MDTFILLKGGHRVHVEGISPQEVENEIANFDDRVTSDGLYLQPSNYPDNGLIIYPSQVVAVVARKV